MADAKEISAVVVVAAVFSAETMFPLYSLAGVTLNTAVHSDQPQFGKVYETTSTCALATLTKLIGPLHYGRLSVQPIATSGILC